MAKKTVVVTFVQMNTYQQHEKKRYEEVDNVKFESGCVVIQMCKTDYYIPLATIMVMRIDN